MSLRPVTGRGDFRSSEGQGEQPGPASWNDGRILFDQRRWICADAEVNWVADHHLVILTEAGDTEHTLVRFNGRTVFEGRDRPGVLTFVPAGTQREGHYRNANLIYSALWIDMELQTELASAEERLLDKGFANGADTVIAPLIAAVGREFAVGQTPESLYMEHVAAVILLRLAAKKGAPAGHPPRGGRLSTRVVRRVEEFIEADLAEDVSLHDLAAVAGLPLDAFARRFKATTGQTPYAYVLERRLIRAESLLADCDRPLGEIALAIGFSSQSHFTATFRRMRGATPRAWRRQFCPES
jgi:AraC family transcriptional regulator